MKSPNPSTLQPFNPLTLRLLIAIPLCASLIVLAITRSLQRRTDANWRECEACARTVESLAPYLKSVRAYEAAKARLLKSEPLAKVPELPLGVPPAGRATERGTAKDGFVSVSEKYSWPSLKTGQAFAVLESFASATPWRIAAVNLKALPDGVNSSLAVTLECAVPAEAPRE